MQYWDIMKKNFRKGVFKTKKFRLRFHKNFIKSRKEEKLLKYGKQEIYRFRTRACSYQWEH